MTPVRLPSASRPARPGVGSLGVLVAAILAVAVLIGVLAGRGSDRVEAQLSAAEGTIDLTNSQAGTAVLTTGPLVPGESRSGEVTIGNAGSAAGYLQLTMDDVSDEPAGTTQPLSQRLTLNVEDVSGAEPERVFSGSFAGLSDSSLGVLEAGSSRRFRFTVSLPDSGGPADDAYQGSAATGRLVWTATDSQPPDIGDSGSGDSDSPPSSDGSAGSRGATTARIRFQSRVRRRGLPARRALLLRVACTRACRIYAYGRVPTGPRGARVYTHPARARLGRAQASTRVRIPLSRRAARRLRQRMEQGREVRVRIFARARDSAGQRRVLSRRLVLVARQPRP